MNRAALAAALLALGAPAAAAQAPTVAWRGTSPPAWTLTGRTAHPLLAEASGVAPSREHPGLLWVITDSGTRPALLAIDSTGALLGQVPIRDAPNTDWEEVALGPCDGHTCLYIADTGDNLERRAEVAIHRLAEPAPPDGVTDARPVETLRFRYPEGAHDVEAMAVLPDGAILLVTKGRSRGILAYRLDPEAWSAPQPVVAVRTDSLPIPASLGTGRVVTGMALSPDGTRAVVRTYRDLFPFRIAEGGRFVPDDPPVACDIVGREPQGEAVGWLPDGRLVLVSERGLFREGTVVVVRGCGGRAP